MIAQGRNTSLMWLPLAGNGTVDLAVTAPGQWILDNTPAGLIATKGVDDLTDARSGEPYLAQISDAGELKPIGRVPAHDDIVVSPGAEWLVLVAPGLFGGEASEFDTLETQSFDGTEHATLTAPAGWAFRVGEWVWEDDDYLVAQVVRNGTDFGEQSYGRPPPVERMARCSPQLARCVLIDSH